ncbi:MAG TPA: flagellar export chaperone FliS [Acidisarcina sp.]
MSHQTELSYRRSATEGATCVGLTIALYDTLAGDLKRAAVAERSGDIEKRTREINHGLTVIGYLESWVDPANGPELAQSLKVLYGYLRGKMMEGQLKRSAEILEEQVSLILQVRGSWQQLELEAHPKGQSAKTSPATSPSSVGAPSPERARGSWSA